MGICPAHREYNQAALITARVEQAADSPVSRYNELVITSVWSKQS